MADERGLRRYIQLIFDKVAGKKAEADAKASVGKIDKAFGSLQTTLKRIGTTLISLFAAREVGRFLRNSIREANELDQANRRLAATAKITGISLGFMDSVARESAKAFQLSRETSADFVIEVSKLTAKAGEIRKTKDALAAFLDLGAARGLDAKQTLTAIRQAILGIDEGTDKLFNKNPSVIYAEFAKQIGIAAGKMTDQQKAQALLNATLVDGGKVRGEYLEWLKTVQGQQFLVSQSIEKFQQTVGKALQPALAKLLPYGVKFIDFLAGVVTWSEKAGLYAEIWTAKANIAVNKVIYGMIGGVAKLGVWIRNAGAGIARFFGFDVGNADTADIDQWVADRNKYWEKMIAGAQAQLNALRGTAVTAYGDITDAVDAATEAIKQQGSATRQLRLEVQQTLPFLASLPGRKKIEPTVRTPTAIPGFGLADERAQEEVFRTLVDMYRDGFGDIESAAYSAASGIQSGFSDAFQMLFEEGGNLGNFLVNVFRAAGAAGLAGLAQYATGKVAENIAQGFEDAAKATAAAAMFNPASAALFSAASKGHFLSAAKWSILAGLAGGAAGALRSGGGSGGGGFSSGSDSGLGRTTAGQTEPQTEIHIHFAGDIEMTNPKFQRLIYGANEFARERFGNNTRVISHPSPRR